MAKNDNCIQDMDGEYSDWIEIYNASNKAIDLSNYALSDDSLGDKTWTFPEIKIFPNDYLLIFASGKNSYDTTELHTNFKLSADGEHLLLINNTGDIVDRVYPIKLASNQAYARIPDGGDNWTKIDIPSPSGSNNGYNNLIFSHQEGFFTEPFTLSIASVLSDTIYYTLNGDIPTEKSNVISSPLLIENQKSRINHFSEIPTTTKQELISYKAWEGPTVLLDKATILRCVSYKNGIRTSKVYTKSFFVDEKISESYTIPVISLVTEKQNLFDSDKGIYVPGLYYNKDNSEWSGNYFMTGDDWERDVHIEYFKNGILGFSQDAGMRIHGGKTRQAAQKTLRLYARDEYGEKFFNYKLLPQRNVERYKRFLLRTTMGAWEGQTIIGDVFAHRIASSLNVDYQEFQPVIVFINGEYWGIHTVRDRIDERYIAYLHNINADSVEFLENENSAYKHMIDFIENHDLSVTENYKYVSNLIDVENYIYYTIAELFFANYDWPGNNIKVWREKPAGKWQWVFYDIDAGFKGVDYNMLEHATKNDPSVTWPNSPKSTFLFRNLLKNSTFENQFIARYAEVLNKEFNSITMTDKLNSIKNAYKPEIEKHIERWNYPYSINSWEKDIEINLFSFIKNRPCAVKDNLITFFGLTDFNFDCPDVKSNENNFVLAPNPSDGIFFLHSHALDLDNATIRVTDINGRIVYQKENVSLKNNERKFFSLTNLSNNMYFMQIIYGNSFDQLKFVILK